MPTNESVSVTAPSGLSQRSLFERHILYALDQQALLQQIINNRPWTIDFELSQLCFEPDLTISAQVLGAYSHSQQVWRWAWSSRDARWPSSICSQAYQIKAYGEVNHLDLLTRNELEVPLDQVQEIGVIVSGLFTNNLYYIADDGQSAVLLNLSGVFLPKIKGPQFDMRIRHTILQTILAYEFNHAVAIEHYFHANSMAVERTGNRLVGTIDGSSHIAQFDELDRLTSLDGSSSANSSPS